MKTKVMIGNVKVGQIYIEKKSEFVYYVESFIYEYDFIDNIYYRVFTLENLDTGNIVHIAENILLKHGTLEKWKHYEIA